MGRAYDSYVSISQLIFNKFDLPNKLFLFYSNNFPDQIYDISSHVIRTYSLSIKLILVLINTHFIHPSSRCTKHGRERK